MAKVKQAPATPAEPPKTGLAKWDERLAALAAAAAKVEENVGGGNMIGTKGGILSYKGTPVPGNNMDVIVVHHIAANLFYTGKYDPNNPQPPVCYAFGEDEKTMRPHEKSAEPQAETCAECPNNAWGSADQGRGKACKNTRRLGLIPASDIETVEQVAAAETAYLHPPVTSVKNWAGFVKQTAENLNRPPLGVIVNVSIVPDPQHQFKVLFKVVNTIDDPDIIGALIEKNAVVAKDIYFPYQEPSAAPPPKAAPANAKWARKGK